MKMNNHGYMVRSNPDEAVMVRSYQPNLTTLNEEERSVEAVLVTENPVLSWNTMTYEVEEDVLLMDGLSPIPKSIPLVDEHQVSGQTIKNILGSTRNMEVRTEANQNKLIGTNFFSSVAEGQSAYTKVKEEHITDNLKANSWNKLHFDRGHPD